MKVKEEVSEQITQNNISLLNNLSQQKKEKKEEADRTNGKRDNWSLVWN